MTRQGRNCAAPTSPWWERRNPATDENDERRNVGSARRPRFNTLIACPLRIAACTNSKVVADALRTIANLHGPSGRGAAQVKLLVPIADRQCRAVGRGHAGEAGRRIEIAVGGGPIIGVPDVAAPQREPPKAVFRLYAR